DVFDGRSRLDLRDDRKPARTHQRAQLANVLGPADEGLGDQIDLQFEGAFEPLPVSRRDGGQAETLCGDVHALTRSRGAPGDAARPDRAAFDRLDGELDRAGGEQDTVAGPQVAGKTRVRGGRAGLVPRTVGAQLE